MATAPMTNFGQIARTRDLGDIVESRGIRLTPGSGRVRQGVCPFHDESEGSFTVYADSQRFHCFGCDEWGDALDFIRKLDVVPEDDQMFVLGDVKVRPSMDKSFSPKSLLAVYLHLYNFGLDQSSNAPELKVRYRIRRGGDLVHETTDNNGESVQFF